LTAALLAAAPALAGEVAEPSGGDSYLSWFYEDTASMLTSPVRGDAGYWGKAALVIATSAVLYDNDGKIRERFSDNHSGLNDDLAKAGELMGHGRFLLPAMGLAWTGGKVFESDYTVESAKLTFEAAALSALGVQAVKLSTHRHRPPNEDGPHAWDGPDFLKSGKDSFPSGHSAGAFSVAAVLANRYGTETWWAAPLIYSIAMVTPLSRVYDDKHWASDAFAGAALGYFTGKAVAGYHPGSRVAVMPQISGSGAGVLVQANF
jgi:hypothetical protein